jgi:hypothetical protein
MPGKGEVPILTGDKQEPLGFVQGHSFTLTLRRSLSVCTTHALQQQQQFQTRRCAKIDGKTCMTIIAVS